MNTSPTIFISLDKKEEKFRNRLIKHLENAESNVPMTMWRKEDVPMGADWEEHIDAAIGSAKLAVLLITKAYLKSEFLAKELDLIMKRHQSGELQILPVILESVKIEDHGWLNRIKFFDANNFYGVFKGQQEKYLVSLAQEIRSLLETQNVEQVEVKAQAEQSILDDIAESAVGEIPNVEQMQEEIAEAPVERKTAKTVTKDKGRPKFWIFSATLAEYDFRNYLKVGEQSVWEVTDTTDFPDKGDIVFFWQKGKKDFKGLYGYGSFEDISDSSSNEWVSNMITCEVIFDTFISGEKLDNVPELRQARSILASKKRNILLSEKETEALIKLIKESGEKAPEYLKNSQEPRHFHESVTTGIGMSVEANVGVSGGENKQKPQPVNEDDQQQFGLASKIDSDIYAVEDELGYKPFVTAIVDLIRHEETEPPLTIGIRAPWGAGKTSIMKQIYNELAFKKKNRDEKAETASEKNDEVKLTLHGLRKCLSEPEKLSDLMKVDINIPEDKRGVVWFNAWKYQKKEQIWAGLAHSIITQVAEQIDGTIKKEKFWLSLRLRRLNTSALRDQIHGYALRRIFEHAPLFAVYAVVFVVSLLLFPFLEGMISHSLKGTTALSLVGGLVHGLGKWNKSLKNDLKDGFHDLIKEPNYEKRLGELHEVETDLKSVLDLVASPKKPLVIFIDDLDRCEPKNVAEVIEAVNFFLSGDYPNCIFVLGMDPNVVAASLEVSNSDVFHKLKELSYIDENEPIGMRFMEKFVQLPISIPPPDDEGLKRYLDSLFGKDEDREEAAESSRKNLVAEKRIEELEKLNTVSAFEEAVQQLENQGVRITDSVRTSIQNRIEKKEDKILEYQKQFKESKSFSEVAKKRDEMFQQKMDEQQAIKSKKEVSEDETEVLEEKELELEAIVEASKKSYSEKFTLADPEVKRVVKKFAKYFSANPRQIKRFGNQLRLLSNLRFTIESDRKMQTDRSFETELPDIDTLGKFIVSTMKWPQTSDLVKEKITLNGKARCAFSALERKALNLEKSKTKPDEKWKEFLEKNEIKFVEKLCAKEFRTFLAEEALFNKYDNTVLW